MDPAGKMRHNWALELTRQKTNKNYLIAVNPMAFLQEELCSMHVTNVLFCSFGQGSSLLWTHALRPFINRPIALAQGGEEFG